MNIEHETINASVSLLAINEINIIKAYHKYIYLIIK